jgi:hypothetical protein
MGVVIGLDCGVVGRMLRGNRLIERREAFDESKTH